MRNLLITSAVIYAIAAILLITDQHDTTPVFTPAVRATVTLGELSPQQLTERAEQLVETTTTTTTTTTLARPSTTVVAVDPATHCQEWFPTAISVGWSNDQQTLEKLGRLLWKETRCMNVTPLSSDPFLRDSFNGHDYGIAQINDIHTKWVEELFDMPFAESMSDPTLNLRFAYLLWESREETGACGWQPWSIPCN